MIDLHCHSNCSDGTDSPKEIASLAEQAGLKAVALTDHDTIAGLGDFTAQQKYVSTQLLTGIELSCEFSGQEIHILGLLINHNDPTFQERVNGLGLRRQRRNAKIIQKLANIGIDICPESFFEEKRLGVLTRAHIAQKIIQDGYAFSKAEVFHKYLGIDGIAYVPFETLSPEIAFSWIRESGGVSIIAHPARYGQLAKGQFIWDRAMADLKDMGAQGIEAYYSDHSDTETAYFLRLCDTLDMIPSGGSDYHGRVKQGCHLGTGWGKLNVPDEVLDRLRFCSFQSPSGF
ncbi:MAG: PHP domain-containing protein [Holophagaceae bacterium]|nr:PHP domain-containing protein [Holophagaceae bacterium]